MALWIPLHAELPRHPKLQRLAGAVGLDPEEVWPMLVRLWWYALEFFRCGKFTVPPRGPSVEELARIAQFHGDPTLWLRSLVECGWVDEIQGGEGGKHFQFHDWQEFAGKLESSREAHARECKLSRERRKSLAGVSYEPRASTDRRGQREDRTGEEKTPLPPVTGGGGAADGGAREEQAGEGAGTPEAEVERLLIQKAMNVLVGQPGTIRQYVGRWIVRVGAMRVEEMLMSREALRATALEIDRRLCPLLREGGAAKVQTGNESLRASGLPEELWHVDFKDLPSEWQQRLTGRTTGDAVVAPAMREILGGGVFKRADAGALANGVSTSDLQREALARLQAERERVCEPGPVCESDGVCEGEEDV